MPASLQKHGVLWVMRGAWSQNSRLYIASVVTSQLTCAGLEAKRPVAKSVKGFAKALQGFLNFPTSLTYDRMIRVGTFAPLH